ncbi:MAG: hypothetical protein ACJA19_001156 [Bacteroidia bacterium]|jgi:hypothetical protein|tara:strand:+ start:397 stop:1263 length:867 start_codon:yes stop_codon:yes gene_type:complete
MKNIKLLSLFALVTLGAVFISSCGTTDDDTPAPKPVLNFLGGSEFIDEDISKTFDQPFKIGITANHTSNIKTFTITQSIDGGVEIPLLDSSLSEKIIAEYIYNGTTAATAGTEIYTFTVADKDGNSTSKSITITNLGDPGLNLDVLTVDNDGATFKVYNFQGGLKGAYGITIGGSLSSTEPNAGKDIQDSTTSAETSSWPARWTSRNGTTFKKVSASSWESITNDSEIAAAWASGETPTSSVNITNGDVYLLNLQSSGSYALVEITDVVSTAGADNNDYVQFKYKKQQ